MFYFSFKYRQLTSRDGCLSYHGNSFKINYFIYVLASPVLQCCVWALAGCGTWASRREVSPGAGHRL